MIEQWEGYHGDTEAQYKDGGRCQGDVPAFKATDTATNKPELWGQMMGFGKGEEREEWLGGRDIVDYNYRFCKGTHTSVVFPPSVGREGQLRTDMQVCTVWV